MQETFSNEVKLAICEAQNNYCAIRGCYNSIHSIHHQLPNNEYNRRKFPLFIHSPFNGVGLCEDCHRNLSTTFRISENLAVVYEDYLQKLKEIY